MLFAQLFWSFFQIGLFSIGGGYAAMPLIQQQMVDQHAWLTMNQFADIMTIAEMAPGPIAINSATFVGIRIAGIPGAIVATLGCITPALILVSLLAFVYNKYKDISVLQNVLSCLRPVVVSLILGAGLSILALVLFNGQTPDVQVVDWIGTGSFVVAFVLLRKFKWNPILTMCLCGAAELVLHLLPV